MKPVNHWVLIVYQDMFSLCHVFFKVNHQHLYCRRLPAFKFKTFHDFEDDEVSEFEEKTEVLTFCCWIGFFGGKKKSFIWDLQSKTDDMNWIVQTITPQVLKCSSFWMIRLHFDLVTAPSLSSLMSTSCNYCVFAKTWPHIPAIQPSSCIHQLVVRSITAHFFVWM